MSRKIIFLLIIALALSLFNGCGEKPADIGGYSVRVMLRPCDGVEIEGDPVAEVKAGRAVTFKISIAEGYTYIGNTAGADFDPETGRLRLTDVYEPKTVDLEVVPDGEVIRLSLCSNNPSGVIAEPEILLSRPGEAAVSVFCPEYLTFDGWSEGGFIEDGGRLLSKNPEDRFYISSSKTLYANFSGFSEYRITYLMNGGIAPDGSGEYTAVGSFSDIYAMQQTLESNGSFVRPGYSAVGYSSEPAEYGEYASANEIPGFSNMGGVCRVEGESAQLYVVWAKENDVSDFDYEIKEIPVIRDVTPGSLKRREENVLGAEITGYHGSGELAVIPEEIEGVPVLSVAEGAFEDASLRRAVIPRTVVNVSEGAFSGSEKLREVVFFDSLATVWDGSFPESVKTVVLNSQRLPVYSGAIEGSFCVKYERLRTAPGNVIAVVSGSSSLNGLDSALFEELMPGYTVVNYGTNAANPSLFYLEIISKYVSEGDIVIHAPEYSSSGPMGSNEFHAKMFRGNEQCWDIFRDADISNYTGFWDCFRKFQVGDPADNSLVPALHQEGKPYQLPADINKYGDIGVSRPSVRGSFGGATENFKKFRLNAENLNGVYEKYRETGALLLMSFGTFDRARLSPEAATEEEFAAFTKKCADALDYPVISDIGTYIMEHKSFYDSEWHPNEEGARERTRSLVADLKAYLADPESY